MLDGSGSGPVPRRSVHPGFQAHHQVEEAVRLPGSIPSRLAESNQDGGPLALVALGVWQAGLILILQGAANRWLERPRAWTAVVAANGMAMTVYLWHMTAMVLTALAVYPTGLWPQVAPLGAAWWALRPMWVAVAGAVLLPLVVLFRRVERSDAPPSPAPAGRPGALAGILGTGATCVGLALVALHGFLVPGAAVTVPLAALAMLGVATALLRPVSLRAWAAP